MINKTKSGISLIVLVITIIVMIILAGAIIISLTNSGIIGKAEEAVNKTNEAQLNQIAQLAWAEAYADGVRTVEDVGGVKGFKSRVEEALTANGIDLSTISLEVTTSGATVTIPQSDTISGLEVGDTVNYVPESTTTSYEIAGKTSGYFTANNIHTTYHPVSDSEFTSQTIARENMTWKVLKNDGKNIYLISTSPSTNKVTLSGNYGYANGATILDTMCNTFYGSSYATARSIKVEDINSIFRPEFDADDETNWTYKDVSSGQEVAFTKGVRTLSQVATSLGIDYEVATYTNGTTGATNVNMTTTQLGYLANYYAFDPGNTKSGKLITEEESTTKYKGENATYKKEYDLVFGAFSDASSKYWVPSQCIHIMKGASSSNAGGTFTFTEADFGLRYIKNGYMSQEYLGYGGDCVATQCPYEDIGVNKSLYYRPIVVLDAATEFEKVSDGVWNIQK